MCKWRQVQDTYGGCGHVYALPDQLIQCDDRYCKFSPAHPEPGECGPNCSITCWQYRQFPEQYNRRINRVCPACEQALQRQHGTGRGSRS